MLNEDVQPKSVGQHRSNLERNFSMKQLCGSVMARCPETAGVDGTPPYSYFTFSHVSQWKRDLHTYHVASTCQFISNVGLHWRL